MTRGWSQLLFAGGCLAALAALAFLAGPPTLNGAVLSSRFVSGGTAPGEDANIHASGDTGQPRLQEKGAGGARSARNLTELGGDASGSIQLAVWIISGIASIVFAFIYKRNVVDQIPPMQQQPNTNGDFAGLCDCCSDGPLCLHTWFCSACRAAHSFQVAGLLNYWVAIFLQLPCFELCSCCIFGYFRGELRKKLGFRNGDAMDYLVSIPCLRPCAIGQEAMSVDKMTGVQVFCCCNLVLKSMKGPTGQAVVGQPIAAAPVTAAVVNK